MLDSSTPLLSVIHTVPRQESRSNDEYGSLLSLAAGTFLEQGVEQSWVLCITQPALCTHSPAGTPGAAAQVLPNLQVHTETQQPCSVRGKYQPWLHQPCSQCQHESLRHLGWPQHWEDTGAATAHSVSTVPLPLWKTATPKVLGMGELVG